MTGNHNIIATRQNNKRTMAQLFDLFGNKGREHKSRTEEFQRQIDQLNAENQKLKTKLHKKDEKTKDALTRKQEVEEILNHTQKQITTLENELLTLKDEASKNISFSGTYLLNKKSFEDVVLELSSVQAQSGALHSIYFNVNARAADFDFGDFIDESCLYMFDQIKSNHGKALFYDENHCISLAIVPPFKIKRSDWITGDMLDTSHLKTMLSCKPTICVVYAHAGTTVIGIIRKDNVHAEIVRTGVQAKHTKGGWSQRRFERGRDHDIDYHIKKVQEKLQSMIECVGEMDSDGATGADDAGGATGINDVGGKTIDVVITGGDLRLARTMIADTLDNIPVIEKRVDVDGNPEDIAVKVAWASRLYRL